MSLGRGMKLTLSALVTLHLLAVVTEPFHFFTGSPRGASEVVRPLRRVLSPYTEFAYLNHGYFFFAPEPGPSHLIECRLEYDEADAAMLRFPDKTAQWPRLLYHRHFMLAEALHLMHAPPIAAAAIAEGDARLLADWQRDRNRFEMIRDSMCRHLEQRYGARKAALQRLEHRLPSSSEVLERGLKLDDETLYLTLPDDPLEAFAEESDLFLPPPYPRASPAMNSNSEPEPVREPQGDSP